jgi:16S rRNA (cytosine967-C5)-methyltransferase
VLLRVEATDAYANILLDARLQSGRLDRPDRALATELVYGVLRWQGRLDWLLAPCLDRPVAALDPVVRVLLRLGTYQLTCLTRIPDFAAVDETVALARAGGVGRAAGYVNAVLRRMAREPRRSEPVPVG